MKKTRGKWTILAVISITILIAGIVYLFSPRIVACPLLMEVSEVKRIGHRYHVSVSVQNPTSEPVGILREEESFPEVFFTREKDWVTLQSQAVGNRAPYSYSNHLDWSSIPSKSTESVEIIFHVDEGNDAVFPELMWDPDLGLRERLSRGLGLNLPFWFSRTRFGNWFRDRCLLFGASQVAQGVSFTPAEKASVEEDSHLRKEAQDFINKGPPKEFLDATDHISYQTIVSYAEFDLETLSKEERVTIEDDASELYERYEDGFSDDALRFGSDLFELVRSICREVEFLHPHVWHGRG